MLMITRSAIDADLAKIEKIRKDAVLLVVNRNDMDWIIRTLFWYIREYKMLATKEIKE